MSCVLDTDCFQQQRTALNPEGQTRATLIMCIVCGLIWITLTNHERLGFLLTYDSYEEHCQFNILNIL